MPPKPNRARRILIPLAMMLIIIGIVAVMVSRPPKDQPDATGENVTSAATATPQLAADSSVDSPVAQSPLANHEEQTSPPLPAEDTRPVATESPTIATPPQDNSPLLTGLRAIAPDRGEHGSDARLLSLGTLDVTSDIPMRIDFATAGAGIERIIMNHHWDTWQAKKQAQAHRAAVDAGDPAPPPMPPEDLRFQIIHARDFMTFSKREGKYLPVSIPALAATELIINGQSVALFDYTYNENDQKIYIWSQVPVESSPGVVDPSAVAFLTEIRSAGVEGGETEGGDVVAVVRRQYSLGINGDITLAQRIENRSDQPLQIQLRQYGPSDLDPDRSQYMDNRRFRFGWLDTQAPDFPNGYVFADDSHLIERNSLLSRHEDSVEEGIDDSLLWPNELSTERGHELTWFASTSRYFAMAVHPNWMPATAQGKSLRPIVDEVRFHVAEDAARVQNVFTYLYSPTQTVPPGQSTSFDMAIYAGPMDRFILGEVEPYASLHMDGIIIYMMSSWCTFCTFQWLAHILMWLLSFFHTIIFDWGVSIILLVVIVRALLHPLLKKSQVGMQRFSRKMQLVQPELQKLQKKYANDPKRMQQEQMRLWREHGVNPLGCLNMLPLFLQMPIWIALYAMLYFAFDLRQQPAFYGIFQMLWDWPFLADLSASDHFFYEFANSHKFLLWNVTGINLLPLLMGVVFFVQQKYMSPPPSPSMSKEMLQQQKIMKVMMVVLFPLMLYSAPSGLTLYILTSSLIGIVESRWIRAHIKEMDLDTPNRKVVTNEKQKKPRGVMGRAYARAIEAAEERRRLKNEPPPPKFKKRK